LISPPPEVDLASGIFIDSLPFQTIAVTLPLSIAPKTLKQKLLLSQSLSRNGNHSNKERSI
jgi:hypothetical protein